MGISKSIKNCHECPKFLGSIFDDIEGHCRDRGNSIIWSKDFNDFPEWCPLKSAES